MIVHAVDIDLVMERPSGNFNQTGVCTDCGKSKCAYYDGLPGAGTMVGPSARSSSNFALDRAGQPQPPGKFIRSLFIFEQPERMLLQHWPSLLPECTVHIIRVRGDSPNRADRTPFL